MHPMNSQKIAVITDSGTNVPPAFAQEHDIRIVPLLINYTDGTYRSEIDITGQQVIDRLSSEVPTTSLPSPSSIREVLEQAKADGYEKAVIVTISSGLSATNQTAHLVASQMEDFPVEVVDTLSIGIAAGLTVIDASLMIEAGVPFEELPGRLNALAAQTLMLFSVDDLTYLRKGGRISEATYRLGSALNIKPIFDCDDEGHYRTVKKCRGRDKALKATINLIAERAKEYEQVVLAAAVAVHDATNDAALHALEEKVTNAVGLISTSISPDLLVHTGPSLLGMAVQPAIPEMAAAAAALEG